VPLAVGKETHDQSGSATTVSLLIRYMDNNLILP